MTTAHNFPDLDISPITPLDESPRSASCESLQVTLPVERVLDEQQSSGGLIAGPISDVVEDSQPRVHNSEENSISLEISLDSAGPTPNVEKNSTVDRSSDEIFRRLHGQVEPALLTSRSSGDDLFQDVENEGDHSCMSTFLQGVFAYVDFQCCADSAKSIKNKLRKMGAIVTSAIDSNNTHVIFSRGGRKSTLQSVLSMSKRPFLIDPHWVHACWFNQFRVPEDSYNLYECQYLLDKLKRRSSAANAEIDEGSSLQCIDLSPDDGLQQLPNKPSVPVRAGSSLSLSEDTELTFDQPMTATQLLRKIDKISKRLDELDTGESNLNHGARCPSRQASGDRPTISHTKSAAVNTVPESSDLPKPLRRRTHGAFALTHRAPYSSSVGMMLAIKEEREAEQGMQDLTNKMSAIKIQKEKVNGVDDMRKTTETDLNKIRKTLQNNSRHQKKKNGNKVGMKSRPPLPPPPRRPDPVFDESDESIHRTPTVPSRRPVINTASAVINMFQNIPSSDEFAGNKQSRIKKKAIVFTGINKRTEIELRQLAIDLSLTVSSKVDHDTRCVVSGNGLRTLSTLRAIILRIPIVKPDWLSRCDQEQRLVSVKDFVFADWNEVIQLRGPKCSLFSRFGNILVVDGCSPPSGELRWMIRKSGGQITTSGTDASLIVSPADKDVLIPWETGTQPPMIVTEKYILDCITENKVLCIADYSDEFSIREG